MTADERGISRIMPLTENVRFTYISSVSPTQAAIVPIESSAKPSRRRKITPEDVKEIAKLVAKRITESGACRILGIKPEQWQLWKHRHAESFERELELIRETQIAAHMENIERAQVKDWRASRELLAMKAPERFATHAAPQSVVIAAVDGNALSTALKRVFASSDNSPKQISQSDKSSDKPSDTFPPAIDV